MMQRGIGRMTPQERQIRESVRSYLLVATTEEMRGELQLSIDREDFWRAICITELMIEERKLVRERALNDNIDWPWCEACKSYHHPSNPTCRAKEERTDA